MGGSSNGHLKPRLLIAIFFKNCDIFVDIYRLQKSINHPFRHIFKFICYELGVTENDQIEDIEEFKAKLVKNADDVFETFDSNYKQKTYTSYILQPTSATISSMEIVELKSLLIQVLGAKIV